MPERSGRPDETSWRATRETQRGFSHEETHHDGTAQSVMNEVVLRDRPRRSDVDSQGGAWPQQLVIGDDEAELELSEARSFVSRVNDQVRKRHKRISNVTEDGEKHSMILENVHDCNNGISSVHGKELLEQVSIHCENNRSHTQTNVRHIYKIGV